MSAKSVKAVKAVKSVKAVKADSIALEFKAIAEKDLKVQDKAFLSCVIGQLALTDDGVYELPLSVKADDGKAVQAYGLVNVERAFYALYAKFGGKITAVLEKREAQDGEFFVVVIKKTTAKIAVKFDGKIKTGDVKLPASSKRAKAAQEKREAKAALTASLAEEAVKASNKTADAEAAKKAEAVKALEAAQKADDKEAVKKAEAALKVAASKEFIARASAMIRKRVPDLDAGLVDALSRDLYGLASRFQF